jgi:hypothetical protein
MSTVTNDAGDGNLDQRLFDLGKENIEHFSVGLMRVGNPPRPDVAELGGSGTLVRAGNVFGILTAAHVVDEFAKSGGDVIGLSFYERPFNRTTFRVARVQKFGKAPYTENGPDLAFYVLSPRDVGALKEQRAFYRIDGDRRAASTNPKAASSGGWMAAGAVGEWSEAEPEAAESGSHKIKHVGGLIITPSFQDERSETDHDYLRLEIDSRWDPERTPRTLQGMSGGGIWHVTTVNGVPDIYLGGVVFYQSALIDGRRSIYCHGRRSVYQTVASAAAAYG